MMNHIAEVGVLIESTEVRLHPTQDLRVLGSWLV